MALEDINMEELFTPPEPAVDVQLSVTFTASSRWAAHVVKTVIDNLPLTSSIEVEFREVALADQHEQER